MSRPFLTARWTDLFLATYAVPRAILEPRLPPGLALDLRAGQAFVSLVAFNFLDTCVLGIPWPGYRNFAELNLRFYVRAGQDRGVMFVREFVPQKLVAWVARTLYNEPYLSAPLSTQVSQGPDTISVEYRLAYARRTHMLRATGKKPAVDCAETSTEHFFKEHRWGYGVTRHGESIRYEVVHPIWAMYPVQDYEVDVDWATVYGPQWGFLKTQAPLSTILAVGSAVQVYPKGKLPMPQMATGKL
jgi:uncharacterized protein YqjF (DUF2071 family)